MTTGTQARNKRIAIRAFDRLLTRCVDIGNNNRVGIIEAGRKLIEQIMQTRITMGLHHRDDTTVAS